MEKNVGREDRTVRIVVAVGLAVILYFEAITGTAAVVAGVIAAYLLVTGFLARCPFYKVAGIDTSVQEQPYSTTDDRSGL